MTWWNSCCCCSLCSCWGWFVAQPCSGSVLALNFPPIYVFTAMTINSAACRAAAASFAWMLLPYFFPLSVTSSNKRKKKKNSRYCSIGIGPHLFIYFLLSVFWLDHHVFGYVCIGSFERSFDSLLGLVYIERGYYLCTMYCCCLYIRGKPTAATSSSSSATLYSLSIFRL